MRPGCPPLPNPDPDPNPNPDPNPDPDPDPDPNPNQVEHELRTKETDFKIHQLCEELQTKAPALGKLALTPAQLHDIQPYP